MSFIDHAYDASERERALLWQAQRARRVQFRAVIEARLRGNPQAGQRLRGNFQPILDHLYDMQLPPELGNEDMETVPISNQELNW